MAWHNPIKHMIHNVRKCTFKRAPSEDSDQPTHSRSLIRIFTGHILHSQKFVVFCHQRIWSDCAVAQADLSLRWAHISEGILFHVAAYISKSEWTYRRKHRLNMYFLSRLHSQVMSREIIIL